MISTIFLFIISYRSRALGLVVFLVNNFIHCGLGSFIPWVVGLLSRQPESTYYYPLITSNGVKLKSNIVHHVLLYEVLSDSEIDSDLISQLC